MQTFAVVPETPWRPQLPSLEERSPVQGWRESYGKPRKMDAELGTWGHILLLPPEIGRD